MEPVIGLDFGTTNSAVAVADGNLQARLASFADGPATTNNFRSILYFPAKERGSQQRKETSVKSYLAVAAPIRSVLQAAWLDGCPATIDLLIKAGAKE